MPARRINPRLIKLHRPYSVEEAARALGVHKNSVRGWIKDGLPTVDHSRPLLILGQELRAYPKPIGLVQHLVEQFSDKDSLILDSFAGSGTTAHAVLAANARDGGNRRFILVEGEDYADRLTAERVRRVINGYAFTGTSREELLREPITFSKLKNANALLEKVSQIEVLDGPKFDRIKSTVKDGALIVTGERDCAEKTPGLGGTFTYCTLGAATEYKRALLSLLSEKFVAKPLQSGGLGLEEQVFDFSAAVVLFGELDAKLPAVIRGGRSR